MSPNTESRALNSNRDASFFVENILGVHEHESFAGLSQRKLILKIASAEKQIDDYVSKNTLLYADDRIPPYETDAARVRLRREIYNELIQNQRLPCDDDIAKGVGGVLPLTPPCNNKEAFILIGLPASGKSYVAQILADKYGAIILDSDYAKRKLPEYEIEFGASIVHEESSVITFGGRKEYAKEASVLQYAISNQYNIVIPKIGNDINHIQTFVSELTSANLDYKVHLILVRIDRHESVRRACNRFVQTGRYVSLSRIFDVYGNDPTITYYDLFFQSDIFESFSMISAEVPIGSPFKIMYSTKPELFSGMGFDIK